MSRKGQLSITTSFKKDNGDPSTFLKQIAEAGFTHVHWGHQWGSDFLYSRWEIGHIKMWLSEYGLQLLDLHGSDGIEKKWASPVEYMRLSGIELAKNRVEMAARLGSDTVIMHTPVQLSECDPVRKSLAELERFCRDIGVRIAIENGWMESIEAMLAEFDPVFLGLCYDSGHGNFPGNLGLDDLDVLKDRLYSIHLHDNNAETDRHDILFSGSVDWERLAKIIATSAYSKCVNMESMMHHAGIDDETEFLKKAFEAGNQFANMVDEERQKIK